MAPGPSVPSFGAGTIVADIAAVIAALVAAWALFRTMRNDYWHRAESEGADGESARSVRSQAERTEVGLQAHLLDCAKWRGKLEEKLANLESGQGRLEHLMSSVQRMIGNLAKGEGLPPRP